MSFSKTKGGHGKSKTRLATPLLSGKLDQRKDEFAMMMCDHELFTCNSRVSWAGHRSQSGPQPAGLPSEQQQSCLVVFVEDWSTQ